jgi:tRNA 2-thiouridine synthesizing protein E
MGMTTVAESTTRSLELDEDGYLRDIDTWDVRIAEQLAQMEGIGQLTAEHWRLITAIRLHYERNRVSPLCRDILIEGGYSKMDMYRLFPALGYRTAYKLAGLPKPVEC